MHPCSFILTSLCAVALTACSVVSNDGPRADKRGQVVYAKECSQCHGAQGEGGGPASMGLGVVPPDLTGLKHRNNGSFPRDFVRQIVIGQPDNADPDSAMPDFATAGLAHVYPKGGADGEALEADFEDLLSYLEQIQN